MLLFSKKWLALLALILGVTLPHSVFAIDSIGGRCFCVTQEYSETYALSHESGWMPEENTELGTEYNTFDASSCESSCRTYADRLLDGRYVSSSYTPPTIASTPVTAPDPEIEYVKPTLSVPIPGVTFSDLVEKNGLLYVRTLPEYIAGVYRYALGIAAILAVVMVMVGGVQYIIGSATGGEGVAQGKQRITNALTGLVLVLAAYVLLTVINPALTSFEAIQIQGIPRSQFEFPPLGEDDDVNPSAREAPEGTSNPRCTSGSATTLSAGADVFVNDELIEPLCKAANALYTSENVGVVVTSGFREPANQLRILWEKCLSNEEGKCDVAVCNPLPESIVTKSSRGGSVYFTRQGGWANYNEEDFVAAATQYASRKACPHTSSVAIDAWCAGSGGDHIFDTDCQDLFGELMQQNGFCRLIAEPWHFELEEYKVSNRCTTSGSVQGMYTVGGVTYSYANCARWDAKNHRCTTTSP